MTGADIAPVRVLLIGMMGAGKTSVGRVLAERTGWPFLDNDTLVQRWAGVEAPQILRDRGEQALREAEAAALMQGLETPPPAIIDVAGGVVTRPEDRKQLPESGIVVWLRARIETLAERVGTGEGRAWLRDDPEAALRSLYEGREELYRDAAALIVDVDDIGPEQV